LDILVGKLEGKKPLEMPRRREKYFKEIFYLGIAQMVEYSRNGFSDISLFMELGLDKISVRTLIS
jgi:hypothetical protein